MHRTEGTNHSGNLFVDGPPGTNVEEDWLNAVQEEFAYAIEQSGGILKTAATETRQQLKTAIDDLADTRIGVADLRRKNAIINGDFNIWQRGTSFAAILTGDYCADRYAYSKTGVMVHTVSRDTDVPTQAESGNKSNYSLKVDCTTIDAAIAAGDHAQIYQRIEGYNLAPFMGNIATLSFWVKAVKTGIYCIAFRNSGADRSYVVEYTVNAASTWEKKTITFTFSDSGGTWDYVNGTGLYFMWALAAGTNFHTTAGSWQNGNFFATANQVNACDNVANNFWLSQVHFELGDVATPFEFNLIQQELVLCQRYSCKSYNQGIDPGTNTTEGYVHGTYITALANADHTIYSNVRFPVEMRTIPTVTLYSLAGTSTKVDMQGGEKAGTVSHAGSSSFTFRGTNGAAHTQRSLGCHYIADSEL